MAKVGKFCLAKRVKVEWLFQAIPERFFEEKLPQGIFCTKTGGLNVKGIVLRVTFSEGLSE